MLLAGFTLVSCSDFGETNLDPNKPAELNFATMLTSAERSISDVVGATQGVLYAQHLSEKQYTEASRYQTVNFDFNGWYTGPLINLQAIIENSDNPDQIAVAKILRAYFFHHMTDRWGALPYTQSLKGAENFKPTYDMQEDIYNDLFEELKSAVSLLGTGIGIQGDFVFGNNVDAWKKFANTIRLNMAIRLAQVNPSKAQSEFEGAYGAGVIESDIVYPYLGEANNQNPWFGRFQTRYDYVASETMVDFMSNLGDPRIDAFFEPAANTGTYVGMPYGIDDAGDIPTSEVSSMDKALIDVQNATLPIYTTAQVEFYLAEAANRGWNVTGTAKEHYEAGIQASMEQWGVFDQTAFDAYIAQPDVAWSAGSADKLIGEQKWVALFLQGYEAWAEWRRTGYPVLTPARDPLNESGLIPVRQAYPVTEQNINGDNYKAAIDMQGEDGLDTKLWWDIN